MISNNKLTRQLIELAKLEDLAEKGDLSSHYGIPKEVSAQARLFSKEPGSIVFSNKELVGEIVEVFGYDFNVQFQKSSSEVVKQ